ncbi:hypothetical protein SAMN05421846_102178 [Chryseobacterium taeanense]|uniref:Uncharacterized protein n=1 Tax=Chryseobacterium taeanense TaxID=311334 RepID=A0A1G8FKH3_9FLAO|nr:hypothetical protein [Chryseobacterium taeanense]SDH82608.1 hypothetical protein SAMN05421846_102178 [Chryseobacterium taeanense]
MEIIKPDLEPELLTDTKTNALYEQLQQILSELEQKKVSAETVAKINSETAIINSTTLRGKDLHKMLKQKQNNIIKLLEKEHKIAPKNYYRNLWLAAGMGAFGLPIGVAFGLLMGNIALLSIGLPIGMAIGIGIGSSMDKKAETEGRQLNIEIKNH